MSDFRKKMPVIVTWQTSNGLRVSYVRNVVTSIIVQVESHRQDVVPGVSMMKARQQERCLTSVSFHSILPFILPSR